MVKIESESTQSDSVGLMCPSSKAKISGQRNVWDGGLSMNYIVPNRSLALPSLFKARDEIQMKSELQITLIFDL